MSKNMTAAQDITEVFIKAVKKSQKLLRKASFESYYDQSQAEELQARMQAAVAGTLAIFHSGAEYCGDCESCEAAGITNEKSEEAANINEARETADEFNRLIRNMLDEHVATRETAAGPTVINMSINESTSPRVMAEQAHAILNASRETAKEYDPKGWPLDTPVGEMTDGEQAKYWKYQSRKNEARAKKYFTESNELREAFNQVNRVRETLLAQRAWGQRIQAVGTTMSERPAGRVGFTVIPESGNIDPEALTVTFDS